MDSYCAASEPWTLFENLEYYTLLALQDCTAAQFPPSARRNFPDICKSFSGASLLVMLFLDELSRRQ